MGEAGDIPGKAALSQVVEHPSNAPSMRPDVQAFVADQSLRCRGPASPEHEDGEPDNLGQSKSG